MSDLEIDISAKTVLKLAGTIDKVLAPAVVFSVNAVNEEFTQIVALMVLAERRMGRLRLGHRKRTTLMKAAMAIMAKQQAAVEANAAAAEAAAPAATTPNLARASAPTNPAGIDPTAVTVPGGAPPEEESH